MDQRTYLALLAPPGLGREEAEELVRRELRRRGEKPWPAMEIELFPGGEASLLIARCRIRQRIYISAAALSVVIDHCE
ncbi:MAG: hypothetical protein E7442_01995 [Ruminococcaceae bacterium]|nr:hypothetical protein [Oscillospiraceae bacterium]